MRLFFLGLGATGIIGAALIGWEVYGAEAKTRLDKTVKGVKQLTAGAAEKTNPEWLDGDAVIYTVDQDTGNFRIATREELEEHGEYREALAESYGWEDSYGNGS